MIEFKDYFKEKFYKERAYEKFQEMASPGVGENKGDVVKRPIHLDKEDINFLHQFPKEFWSLALNKRYEFLHDELSKLHDKRMKMGFKQLESKLKAAMSKSLSGDESAWDGLEKDMSPETIKRLKRDFSKENIYKIAQSEKERNKIIEDEANKEAYEEIKEKTDFLEDPSEPIDFKFGKKTIVAHPYLNRLYHKIERTRGLDHRPESGLSDFEKAKGEYGYDLAHPKTYDLDGKKVRTTRGSGSWPDAAGAGAAVASLVNLNQHNIFGDLKVPENAEWRAVLGAGGKPEKDHWTWDRLVTKYFKKIYRELTNANKHARENEKRNEAYKMAKEAAFKDAEEGKLFSPAIPAKNPDGSPITTASGELLPPDSRKFKIENGKLVMPVVYLPHIPKKFVTKNELGKKEEMDHWVPIVNPAHAFREVGDEESDYEKDETGKRTGKFNWDSLKEKLTGIPDEEGNKKYVRVGADEYHKSGNKGHQAPAAFHLNQNSKGKYFISRGDPKYRELYEKIFGGTENGGMKLVDDKISGAKLYNDFKLGILGCLSSSKCGGAGPNERLAIRQNIPDIHTIVVAQALDNLGDPKLLTKSGRVAFANALTGGFAQTNIADGPRRRRILNAKLRDISRNTTGAEGGEIGDSIDGSVDTSSGSAAADRLSKAGEEAEKGRRKLPKINWLQSGNTAYNVDAFRSLMSQIQQDAAEADSSDQEAKLNPEDINKLSSAILDKAQVISMVKELLKKIYSASDASNVVDGLDKNIEDEIKDWIDDGAKDASQIVAKFKTHPLVMQYFGNNKDAQPDKAVEKAQEKAPEQFGASHANISLQKDEIDIINKLKSSPEFKSIQSLYGTSAWEEGKKALLATAGNKYSTFVSKWAERKIQSGEIEINPNSEERILVAMQHFLDNQFNLNSIAKVSPAGKSVEGNPLQKLMAARKISKEPSKPEVPVAAIPQPGRTKSSIYDPSSRDEDFYFLASAQRWIDLIKHPDFETEKLPPRYYNSLAGMVARWFQNKWISQEEYQELESRIKRKL